jgi:hypothetical protein
VQSRKTEDQLSNHTQRAGHDKDNPRSDFVDQHASDERDDDVGKRIEGIEQIKGRLPEFLTLLVLVTVLDVLLESLYRKKLTLGRSKQYSKQKTVRMARIITT